MSKKVIVFEGSCSVREMVAFALREAGYEVLEAANEGDALARLADSSADLMIADMSTSPKEKLDIIEAARSSRSVRPIPLVLVTAEPGGSRKGFRGSKEAAAYIVKPFTPDQLVAVLRRVLA